MIKVLTSGAGAQTRSFNYDLRGYLLSETHPEEGLFGNGSVIYSRYDALGNARKKVDGTHDLRYTFDRAIRWTQVTELPPQASVTRKIQEWTYGTVNEGGNRKLGKVIEQTRWNFIQLSTVPPTPYTGRIKEFFTYAGRDGRISSSRLEGRAFVTGTIPEPEGPTEKFESSWIYDPLGNVTSIDYPRCIDNNPEPDSCPNPSEVARVVTPTYWGTNRLATAGSQYDASGNLTNWSTTAIYGWDALDKMWRMKNGSEEWYYFYNADGERVWSYRFGGTHSRWTPRDPGGMVPREFEVLNGTWQIPNDYIYRGSQLLASETLSGVQSSISSTNLRRMLVSVNPKRLFTFVTEVAGSTFVEQVEAINIIEATKKWHLVSLAGPEDYFDEIPPARLEGLTGAWYLGGQTRREGVAFHTNVVATRKL